MLNRGGKIWARAALCVLALGLASCSKPVLTSPSNTDVHDALAGLTTASGASALDRMEACDLRINWTASTVTLIPMDADSVDMKSGDRILAVDFSAPSRPGQAAGRTVAQARWLFREGEINPRDSWASSIQMAKPPMGSAFYLNC